MNFMFIMYMLCFCTLCSYATCEWPAFYVNKDMFRSVLFIFKRFGKQNNEQICLNSSPIFFYSSAVLWFCSLCCFLFLFLFSQTDDYNYFFQNNLS